MTSAINYMNPTPPKRARAAAALAQAKEALEKAEAMRVSSAKMVEKAMLISKAAEAEIDVKQPDKAPKPKAKAKA